MHVNTQHRRVYLCTRVQPLCKVEQHLGVQSLADRSWMHDVVDWGVG